MIKDIVQKTGRLVKFNRILQIKLIGGAVLLAATGVLGARLKALDGAAAKSKAEWELVMQVPAMEKKLRTKNLKLLKPESQIIAIKTILEGTSFRDNVYQAVIDGEVYSTGDVIGDYKIIDITLKTILLENSKMFEIKELSFPENSAEQTKL
ncbi:MAG: hypothetical protein A3C36_03125 [Omnitrophica WOR_2 bacterium RIFCSPHIGHO2_02_FULL_52_10]|nr:MAG: hypothetical protein A3C36_03125 [Omnitrophica WOR_2 bacterium RIFCSPHIGHO2_02_FULL_52_10]